MFKQFKLIEQGVFTKEETRECLSEIGLISNGLVKIGEFTEYFKKQNAGILYLRDYEISVGEEIYACKADNWIRTSIKSLQLNDTNVESVKKGEVGIVTECALEKGYELFVKG